MFRVTTSTVSWLKFQVSRVEALRSPTTLAADRRTTERFFNEFYATSNMTTFRMDSTVARTRMTRDDNRQNPRDHCQSPILARSGSSPPCSSEPTVNLLAEPIERRRRPASKFPRSARNRGSSMALFRVRELFERVSLFGCQLRVTVDDGRPSEPEEVRAKEGFEFQFTSGSFRGHVREGSLFQIRISNPQSCRRLCSPKNARTGKPSGKPRRHRTKVVELIVALFVHGLKPLWRRRIGVGFERF